MPSQYGGSFADRLAEFLLGLAQLQATREGRDTQGILAQGKLLGEAGTTANQIGQLEESRSRTSLAERQYQDQLAEKKREYDAALRRREEEGSAVARFLGFMKGEPQQVSVPGAPATEMGTPGLLGPRTPDFQATIPGRPRSAIEAASMMGSVAGSLPKEYQTALLKLVSEFNPEFTLSPGQARFRGGQQIAGLPEKPEAPSAEKDYHAMAEAELGANAPAAQVARRAQQLAQSDRIAVSAAQGREAARQELAPVEGAPTGEFAAKPGETIGAYKARTHAEAQAGATNRANLRTQMQEVRSVLDRLDELAPDAFQSVGEGIGGRAVGAVRTKAELLGQSNQEAVQFNSLAEGTLAPIIRALGEKGTLAEGDVKRARALIPSLGATPTGLPDTPTTARNKLKQLRQLMLDIEQKAAGANRPTGEAAPSNRILRFNPSTGQLE